MKKNFYFLGLCVGYFNDIKYYRVDFIDDLGYIHSLSNLFFAASEKLELTTSILRNSYAVNLVVNDLIRSHK